MDYVYDHLLSKMTGYISCRVVTAQRPNANDHYHPLLLDKIIDQEQKKETHSPNY
jgi:hypothetical protein